LKKFFYALRTSTTCKWILEKSEIPPIEFKRILDGLDINKNLLLDIERLTTLKSQKDETYLHSGEKELFSFISENIKNAEEKSNSLPSAKFDSETLNIFFRKTLEDVWK
jgi:hypothetical protein